jgi:nucleoporin NUP2
VGFGFGVGVAKPADGASEPSSSSAPAEFSFGAPSTKSVSPSVDTTSRRSESQPAGGEEDAHEDAKLLPSSNHDEEGEGEESEETVFTVKAKLFKLTKTSDKSEWKDLGVG